MNLHAKSSPRICCAIFLLLIPGSLSLRAQNIPERFQHLLENQMNVSEANLASLDRGEAVTKLLKTKAKKEIAALGVVRVNAPIDLFIARFRDIAEFKKSAAVLQIGKFSNPPRLADLEGLTLDTCCLEAVKSCRTGDCGLKMSSAMMTRFREELDPSAADYHERANALIRRVLFDYVKAYLETGNAALIEYQDGGNPVRLADEYRSLLEQSRFLADYAPEFNEYLGECPTADSPNIENFIYWSKEKYGLKPVLSITHVVIYRRVLGKSAEVLIASKQLYANHYFEGSLGLTVFVESSQGPAIAGSYLMYLNRSRADALQGWLPGIKRSLVGSRVRDALAKNLKLVKRRIESHHGFAGVCGPKAARRNAPGAKGQE